MDNKEEIEAYDPDKADFAKTIEFSKYTIMPEVKLMYDGEYEEEQRMAMVEWNKKLIADNEAEKRQEEKLKKQEEA